ncbi:MAG: hypothetical protein HKN32_00730 [Flavobacteriales bacterium]|nr:hypothetical protein [Flavobacteriales bacterium]
MKKIIVLSLFLGLALVSFSQKKEKIIQPALDSACDCLDEIAPDSPSLEMELQMCIITAFTSEADAFMKYYDLDVRDMDDEAKMEEIGVDFAMLLMADCPAFMQVAMGMAEEESGMADDGIYEEVADEMNFYTGSVTSVNKDDFIYVTIAGDDGMNKTFVLLENMPGTARLLSGDEVYLYVDYENTEVYSSKSGEFESEKVIRYIEIIE